MEKKNLRNLLIGLSIATGVMSMEQAANASDCYTVYNDGNPVAPSNIPSLAAQAANGDIALCKEKGGSVKHMWNRCPSHPVDTFKEATASNAINVLHMAQSSKVPAWSDLPVCGDDHQPPAAADDSGGDDNS